LESAAVVRPGGWNAQRGSLSAKFKSTISTAALLARRIDNSDIIQTSAASTNRGVVCIGGLRGRCWYLRKGHGLAHPAGRRREWFRGVSRFKEAIWGLAPNGPCNV